MNEGKCLALICSLCLMMILSTPAFAARSEGTPHPKAAVLRVKKKARMSQEKLNELNAELFAAVDECNRSAAVRVLGAGAKVNAADRAGMTPLMHAALRGESGIVRMLLNKGARVNMMDIFGVTALMQAAWAGHTGVVQILVEHGADPNLQSTEETPKLRIAGVSALMGACMNDNFKVAKLLLARGANVNQRDAQGQTALMYAARQGDPHMVNLLISNGAQMEIKDQFGRTALTLATIYGRYYAVCMLVSAGANVFTTDIHNMTPSVYASALDHGRIGTFLKAAMARQAACRPAVGFKAAP